MGKLTCTNSVIFERSQDSIDHFFKSKIESNYLVVKLKVLKKDDIRDFRLVQNKTIGQADFNQFVRLRIPLIVAAEKFWWRPNFAPFTDYNNVQR